MQIPAMQMNIKILGRMSFPNKISRRPGIDLRPIYRLKCRAKIRKLPSSRGRAFSKMKNKCIGSRVDGGGVCGGR